MQGQELNLKHRESVQATINLSAGMLLQQNQNKQRIFECESRVLRNNNTKSDHVIKK